MCCKRARLTDVLSSRDNALPAHPIERLQKVRFSSRPDRGNGSSIVESPSVTLPITTEEFLFLDTDPTVIQCDSIKAAHERRWRRKLERLAIPVGWLV
jgi:hypothetical protein